MMPPAMPAGDLISVRGVGRRFGTVQALDAVDLGVAAGEVVALMGPSGAGKSTLLRILATLVTPDAGSAAVCGADVVRDAGAVRRAIGLVLGDEHTWYWRLTGRANLEFFAALHGMRRPAARDAAQELLTAVGLDEAADLPVGGWSSGMRARLAVARGLLARPRVLLLDEPTRSLDVGTAATVRELVRDHVAGGAAALLVTHSAEEAAALASRTVVLGRGRVVAQAGPSEALEALVREAPR